MIFYTSGIKEFTHTVLQRVAKGYDFMFYMRPSSHSNAQSILEKWNERYELTRSTQQQYRKFLAGESTFCCIVYNVPTGYVGIENFGDAEFYRYLKDKSDSNRPFTLYTPTLVLLCRVNPTLLYLADGTAITNKYDHIELINTKLAQKINGCEQFTKPKLSIKPYEFVQLTKRAKSIKELQDMGLTQNTKHATNFTWRLNKEKYEEIRLRGVHLVNSYQNIKSNGDINSHFEKYLLSLEGYIGYRGVRVQIGKLYNLFISYFRSKINRSFAAAGGRKLNLSYVRASSPKIENNTEIHRYFRKIKDNAKVASREALSNWKSSPSGQDLLKSKSRDGYVYNDSYYENID